MFHLNLILASCTVGEPAFAQEYSVHGWRVHGGKRSKKTEKSQNSGTGGQEYGFFMSHSLPVR